MVKKTWVKRHKRRNLRKKPFVKGHWRKKRVGGKRIRIDKKATRLHLRRDSFGRVKGFSKNPPRLKTMHNPLFLTAPKKGYITISNQEESVTVKNPIGMDHPQTGDVTPEEAEELLFKGAKKGSKRFFFSKMGQPKETADIHDRIDLQTITKDRLREFEEERGRPPRTHREFRDWLFE